MKKILAIISVVMLAVILSITLVACAPSGTYVFDKVTGGSEETKKLITAASAKLEIVIKGDELSLFGAPAIKFTIKNGRFCDANGVEMPLPALNVSGTKLYMESYNPLRPDDGTIRVYYKKK